MIIILRWLLWVRCDSLVACFIWFGLCVKRLILVFCWCLGLCVPAQHWWSLSSIIKHLCFTHRDTSLLFIKWSEKGISFFYCMNMYLNLNASCNHVDRFACISTTVLSWVCVSVMLSKHSVRFFVPIKNSTLHNEAKPNQAVKRLTVTFNIDCV